MAYVKIARFFAVIFALAGIVLMLGTSIICFASIHSSAKILENPDGAVACSEGFRQSLQAGNLTEASGWIYGRPDLGAEGIPEDACAARLWEAYLGSISLDYSRMYLLDGDLGRDGELTVLDVSKVTEGMQRRAKAMLEEKAASAEGEQLSQQQREQILLQALEEALREDRAYLTRDVSVKLVFRDGAWWAVPDSVFVSTLTGFGG